MANVVRTVLRFSCRACVNSDGSTVGLSFCSTLVGGLKRLYLVALVRDPHRLVHFFFNYLAGRWLHRVQISLTSLVGRTLALQAVALRVSRLVGGRESFSHVLVALVLLVDEVVGCGDVIVTVGLHASYRVLLLELEILDQSVEQVSAPRHLLHPWEETRISRNWRHTSQVGAHVGMRADILDTNSRFRVGIQNFLYEIFALG